ncbi:MAG: hypothetical protein PHF33_08125 [Candidatus Delongbacteria bacterium]|jgi:hypothetical protein|nr:hypothetical protein [Candidatus Delongbacteria bacterium]
MSGNNVQHKIVQIDIVEVKKLSYYEKLLESFNKEIVLDRKKIPIDFSIKYGIDFKDNLIMLELGVDFRNNDKDKINLFGISTYHKFHISDIQLVLKKEDGNKSSINKPFLANILGIAISSTRGMLAVLNTTDDYKNILLPMINPMAIIENSKQDFIVVKEKKLSDS